MSAHARRREDGPLAWSEICALAERGHFDGYHVDTDEWGRILMTPVNLAHGLFAIEIALLLREHLPDGRSVAEVGVATRKGVKAPDVMWFSRERLAARSGEFEDALAGEICVEVLSSSNHPSEIDEKRRLYFEQDAVEVWVCDTEGRMRFWIDGGAERARSALAPDFPARISTS